MDNYCNGSFDKTVCRINLTNGFSSYEPDVDFAKYCACTDVGVVTLRMQIEDDPFHTKDIFEDHCSCFTDESGLCNDSAYGDVINVGGGDRYHFSARYNF